MSKKNEKESDAVFNPIILCVFTCVEETNEKKGRLDIKNHVIFLF